MSPHLIELPDNSGILVEQSSPECLRVRTNPVSPNLRKPAIAFYGILICWILWRTGSKLVALMSHGASPAMEGQAGHGTANAVFGIFVSLGISAIVVSAICCGILWLACGYQRLHVEGGVLEYESRFGPCRLTHRRAFLTDITGMSITDVGAQANGDVQATALVITTRQWKVNFGASATFPGLHWIIDELQRMKTAASISK